MAERPTCYCSFCGKSEREVLVLIAGPAVFICDECVAPCVEIVESHRAAATPDHIMSAIQTVGPLDTKEGE